MSKNTGNRRATVGPATEYIASELRAQRGRLGWTMGQVAENSGVPKSTVSRAMSGDASIPAEVLVLLAVGMEMDLTKVMNEAKEIAGHYDCDEAKT